MASRSARSASRSATFIADVESEAATAEAALVGVGAGAGSATDVESAAGANAGVADWAMAPGPRGRTSARRTTITGNAKGIRRFI